MFSALAPRICPPCALQNQSAGLVPSYWDARSIDASLQQSASFCHKKKKKKKKGGKKKKARTWSRTHWPHLDSQLGKWDHSQIFAWKLRAEVRQKRWDSRAKDGEAGSSWCGSLLSAWRWQTDGEWGSPDAPLDVPALKRMPCVRMSALCLMCSRQMSFHCKWCSARVSLEIIQSLLYNSIKSRTIKWFTKSLWGILICSKQSLIIIVFF